MGRGIAKRTIFECRDDFRYFLALLAREVRRGTIEIHAFALMQTHYHLLVRSPLGKLSKAMERVLRAYTRWFNRRRDRDGRLFRERFKSKRVDGEAYRSLLVRYVDDNPVEAELAPHAAAYPYGSAFHYAQFSGPTWLERTWIEEEVRSVRGVAHYAPRDYGVRFPSRLPRSVADWIQRALVRRQQPEKEFAGLLAPHAQSKVDWMVRRTLLADGMEPFRIPLPAGLVEEEWARLRAEQPDWPWDVAREREALWQHLRTGLLRHGCALSYAEIRARTGAPQTTSFARACRHREALTEIPEYAQRVAVVIERVQRRLLAEAYPHRFVAANARAVTA